MNMMQYKLTKDMLKIDLGQDFSAKQIYESGQVFRWYEVEENKYRIVHNNMLITLVQNGNDLSIYPIKKQELDKWLDYFDIYTDYGQIKKDFLKLNDKYLSNAIDFGRGMRILNQDIFETIISFIISANNHIPRIRKNISDICIFAGKKIASIDGVDYHAFPTPMELNKMKETDLDKVKLGYRKKYIIESAKMIASGEFDLNKLKDLDTQSARKELCKLSGVGPKVADCILLFSLKKYDVFPADTWIRKVMSTHYRCDEKAAIKVFQNAGREIFGDLCGIAQQYIFYYGRSNE